VPTDHLAIAHRNGADPQVFTYHLATPTQVGDDLTGAAVETSAVQTQHSGRVTQFKGSSDVYAAVDDEVWKLDVGSGDWSSVHAFATFGLVNSVIGPFAMSIDGELGMAAVYRSSAGVDRWRIATTTDGTTWSETADLIGPAVTTTGEAIWAQKLIRDEIGVLIEDDTNDLHLVLFNPTTGALTDIDANPLQDTATHRFADHFLFAGRHLALGVGAAPDTSIPHLYEVSGGSIVSVQSIGISTDLALTSNTAAKWCMFSDDSITLDHGAVTGGPFLVGERVVGAVSGAEGFVVDEEAAFTVLRDVRGDFQIGELITGDTTGATVGLTAAPTKNLYVLCNYKETGTSLPEVVGADTTNGWHVYKLRTTTGSTFDQVDKTDDLLPVAIGRDSGFSQNSGFNTLSDFEVQVGLSPEVYLYFAASRAVSGTWGVYRWNDEVTPIGIGGTPTDTGGEVLHAMSFAPLGSGAVFWTELGLDVSIDSVSRAFGGELLTITVKAPPTLLAHGAVVGGPFIVGETVTGGTSGATGEVVSVGAARLFLKDVAGVFEDGETATGATSTASTTLSAPPDGGDQTVTVDLYYDTDGSISNRRATIKNPSAGTLVGLDVTGLAATYDGLTFTVLWDVAADEVANGTRADPVARVRI
jgi:hypothetical protein